MRVVIATPMHDGRIHGVTADAITEAVCALMACGYAPSRIRLDHESFIARARNLIVHEFLASTEDPDDRLMHVDSDIAFGAKDMLALVESRLDVVGGVYAKKDGSGAAVAAPLPNGAGAIRGPHIEVARIGTGFLSVTRRALVALREAHADRSFTMRGGPFDGQRVCAIFDTAISGDECLTEDWLLCDRWRAIGGQVWAHSGVRLGHVGSTSYEVQP